MKSSVCTLRSQERWFTDFHLHFFPFVFTSWQNEMRIKESIRKMKILNEREGNTQNEIELSLNFIYIWIWKTFLTMWKTLLLIWVCVDGCSRWTPRLLWRIINSQRGAMWLQCMSWPSLSSCDFKVSSLLLMVMSEWFNNNQNSNWHLKSFFWISSYDSFSYRCPDGYGGTTCENKTPNITASAYSNLLDNCSQGNDGSFFCRF